MWSVSEVQVRGSGKSGMSTSNSTTGVRIVWCFPINCSSPICASSFQDDITPLAHTQKIRLLSTLKDRWSAKMLIATYYCNKAGVEPNNTVV